MHEPVAREHPRERVGERRSRRRGVDPGGSQPRPVVHLHAPNVLHGEHAAGGEGTSGFWRDHSRVVGERAPGPLAASTLPREVELPREPVAKFGHEERKIKRGKRDANRAGDEAHGREVHVELSPQSRSLHLHRHLLAGAGHRPVHLRQRRRREGLAIEFAKRRRPADAAGEYRLVRRPRAPFHRVRRGLVGQLRGAESLGVARVVPPAEVHEVFHRSGRNSFATISRTSDHSSGLALS